MGDELPRGRGAQRAARTPSRWSRSPKPRRSPRGPRRLRGRHRRGTTAESKTQRSTPPLRTSSTRAHRVPPEDGDRDGRRPGGTAPGSSMREGPGAGSGAHPSAQASTRSSALGPCRRARSADAVAARASATTRWHRSRRSGREGRLVVRQISWGLDALLQEREARAGSVLICHLLLFRPAPTPKMKRPPER